MSLLFNILSRFVIVFVPSSKHLLISWLQSVSAVILEPNKIISVIVSIFSPSICYKVMGLDAMILNFWTLCFKPDFSFSSFLHQCSLVPLLPLDWCHLHLRWLDIPKDDLPALWEGWHYSRPFHVRQRWHRFQLSSWPLLSPTPSSEMDRDMFLEIYLPLLGIYSDWTATRCNGKYIPSQTDGESFNTTDY